MIKGAEFRLLCLCKNFLLSCNLSARRIVIIVKGPFKTGGEKMTETEFTSAVERNSQRLYLIALSFTKSPQDAEDIIQNVFFKLWNYGGSFEGETHTDKWLTTVCVNESKNLIKSPFRKRCSDIDELSGCAEFDSITEQDIFSAVMSLPQKERTVVHLFYYEDMTVKEIAKLLKQSESAVKTHLYRARKNLKENLGDEWINE